MILLNTKYCDTTFSYIQTIDEIKHTKEYDIIYFLFDEKLCLYAKNNDLSYMVVAKSIKECILANELGARYILLKNTNSHSINNKILKRYMKVAQNYLFDSKIIFEIDSLDEIDKIATSNIDGIYLKTDIC